MNTESHVLSETTTRGFDVRKVGQIVYLLPAMDPFHNEGGISDRNTIREL